MHGITLAFGFTLIGVAQDYPLHLLSHRRADLAAREIARRIWPTLATGVASTCIAYLTFLFSGVLGLAQLACFTVTALAVASARHALPAAAADGHARPRLRIVARRSGGFGTPSQACRGRAGPRVALLAACAAAIAFGRAPLWDNDLANLTPVPAGPRRARPSVTSRARRCRYAVLARRRRERHASRARTARGARSAAASARGARRARGLRSRGALSAVGRRAAGAPGAIAGTRAAAGCSRRGREPHAVSSGCVRAVLADVAAARTLTPLTPMPLDTTPLAATLDPDLVRRRRRARARGVSRRARRRRLCARSPRRCPAPRSSISAPSPKGSSCSSASAFSRASRWRRCCSWA